MEKVLFVLKFREQDYGKSYSYGYFSSGLYWSAKFVVDMLVESGIDAKLIQVIDNNDIDREVTKFKPDVVIIEALWVVPEKFDVLKRLHPNITWVVRLHSNIPFLANEGIALSWVKGYAARGILVGVNEKRAFEDIEEVLDSTFDSSSQLVYLPNFYPIGRRRTITNPDDILHIGCFGAIRPLKNQLIQAIAAMRYAEDRSKVLFFHINATRTELNGNSVLENLRALFAGTDHVLVEDKWFSHSEFLNVLASMDLGMQVSLSETFSIVAADMVSVGLPVVVSSEIRWANWFSRVDPTDSVKITEGIKDALKFRELNILINRANLRSYSKISKKIWLDFLK